MPQSGIFIVNIFKILSVSFVFQQKPSSPQEKGLGEGFPWQIDGETVETVADFTFLDSKITADGDCSHEIKRPYSLEGKL